LQPWINIIIFYILGKHSLIKGGEISGSHITKSEDFWNQIAEKIKIPSETETTTTYSSEVNTSGELAGKGGIPLIVDLTAKGALSVKSGDSAAIHILDPYFLFYLRWRQK
jgi:hypothetical protein